MWGVLHPREPWHICCNQRIIWGEFVLPIDHVGPGDWIQAISLGDDCLCLLNHLVDALQTFNCKILHIEESSDTIPPLHMKGKHMEASRSTKT